MVEEQKSWFLLMLKRYKKPLLIVLIGVMIFIFFIAASSGKSYVVEIIHNLVKQQVEIIEQNYVDSLKEKDIQIQDLQERLSASEQEYNNLKKRVGNVEKRIVERKQPATTGELRDRLNQLGYSPVN